MVCVPRYKKGMRAKSDSRELHPAGETPFSFQFAPGGGKFHLSDCDERLTAYKRLQAWLSATAPQLPLTAGKPPPWSYFDPDQHSLIAPS